MAVQSEPSVESRLSFCSLSGSPLRCPSPLPFFFFFLFHGEEFSRSLLWDRSQEENGEDLPLYQTVLLEKKVFSCLAMKTREKK